MHHEYIILFIYFAEVMGKLQSVSVCLVIQFCFSYQACSLLSFAVIMLSRAGNEEWPLGGLLPQ